MINTNMTSMQAQILSARLFITARISLGILLAVYWIQLIQDRDAVFFIVPFKSEAMAAAIIGGFGALLAMLLAAGVFRRLASFLSSILLVGFVWISPFVANVSIGYLTFLLLLLAFVPQGESWREANLKASNWKFPDHLFWALWIVIALSYTESGIDKILHPTWRSGEAITQLFNYSLAVKKNVFTDFIANHSFVAQWLTWGTMGLETIFALSLVLKKTRLILWVAMVALHLSIMSTMAIYYISFGMLILHVFLISRIDLLGLDLRDEAEK